jgi:hypothetical protein
MEWISVKDRLPDSIVDVLIFDPYQNDMIVGWFNAISNKWVSGLSAPEDYFEIDVEPTHWMPLPPEPPKL